VVEVTAATDDQTNHGKGFTPIEGNSASEIEVGAAKRTLSAIE
jgi:hypothetical protein